MNNEEMPRWMDESRDRVSPDWLDEDDVAAHRDSRTPSRSVVHCNPTTLDGAVHEPARWRSRPAEALCRAEVTHYTSEPVDCMVCLFAINPRTGREWEGE